MPIHGINREAESYANTIEIATYCLELYRKRQGLTTGETSKLFNKHGVYDYLMAYGHLVQTEPDDVIYENIKGVILRNVNKSDA